MVPQRNNRSVRSPWNGITINVGWSTFLWWFSNMHLSVNLLPIFIFFLQAVDGDKVVQLLVLCQKIGQDPILYYLRNFFFLTDFSIQISIQSMKLVREKRNLNSTSNYYSISYNFHTWNWVFPEGVKGGVGEVIFI